MYVYTLDSKVGANIIYKNILRVPEYSDLEVYNKINELLPRAYP